MWGKPCVWSGNLSVTSLPEQTLTFTLSIVFQCSPTNSSSLPPHCQNINFYLWYKKVVNLHLKYIFKHSCLLITHYGSSWPPIIDLLPCLMCSWSIMAHSKNPFCSVKYEISTTSQSLITKHENTLDHQIKHSIDREPRPKEIEFESNYQTWLVFHFVLENVFDICNLYVWTRI